jgi:methylated-DNA-[protein]-cysteine S-methyltransferase
MTSIEDRTAAWDVYESPFGPLTLFAGRGGALTGLAFPGRARGLAEDGRDPAALAGAAGQLEAYFAGERRAFELDLDLRGTPFQQRVWAELRRIPYGATVSYTQLAERIGRSDIVRAVGAAVGRTPVPIIVPCHRVLGADGSLTGYGGGLQRKRALLDLERRVSDGDPAPPGAGARQMALL